MRNIAVVVTSLLMAWPLQALAEPTPLSVYVLSRDAKFVGSSVGGARITIQDAQSGEVLAQGVTEGSTGDTERIMRQPRSRDASIVTPDAAHFATTLDLEAPRQVRIIAYGPLSYPESANTVSAVQWVIPGADRSDSAAVILELPGLVVDLHDVPTLVSMSDGEARVPVQARVTMMCGCPLTPDGLWDSNAFEIEAQVMQNGEVITSTPLRYAGQESEFEGELRVMVPGTHRLRVVAHQPATGNAGLAETTLVTN